MGPYRIWLAAAVLAFSLPLAAEDEQPAPPAQDRPAVESPAAQGTKFLNGVYANALAGREVPTKDKELLASLAKAGWLKEAKLVPADPPKLPGVEFKVAVDGRAMTVRVAPGAQDQAIFSVRGPSDEGFRAPGDLSSLPFFKDLPAREAQAPGSSMTEQQRATLLASLAGAGAVFGAGLRDAPGAVAGAAVAAGAAAGPDAAERGPASVPRPPAPRTGTPPASRYETRKLDDGYTYLFRDGKNIAYRFESPGKEPMYYSESTGIVYSGRGPLGKYDDVMARFQGRGAPESLTGGPRELGYVFRNKDGGVVDSPQKLEAGGKVLSPDGKTVLGYVPNDPRYGKEKVIFFHGDNTDGNGKTPWSVYSMKGDKLGSYEQVRAYTVGDHDGGSRSRVLVPIQRDEYDRGPALYRDLSGGVYQYGARGFQPYFNREQTEKLQQLQKLKDIQGLSPEEAKPFLRRETEALSGAQAKATLKEQAPKQFDYIPAGPLRDAAIRLALGRIERMSEDQAKDYLLKQVDALSPEAARKNLQEQAQKKLDEQFLDKFPIGRKAELTKALSAYEQSLQAGDMREVQKQRAHIEALAAKYSQQHRDAQDAYDKVKSEQLELNGVTKSREDHVKDLDARIKDIDKQMKALENSGYRWTDYGMQRERRLRDQQSALESQRDELDRPILTAADQRNRAKWLSVDLAGAARGLTDPSVSRQLSETAGLRKELDERLAGVKPEERRAAEWAFMREKGLTGPQQAVLEFTRAYQERQDLLKKSDADWDAFQRLRTELRGLPPGSSEYKELKARADVLESSSRSTYSQAKGRYEDLEYTLNRADNIRRAFSKLDEGGADRDYWERNLRETFRFELRQGETLDSLRQRWTGQAWEGREGTLQYLSGVRSALEWDLAIKDRRGNFDMGIRMLQDPTVSPALKKRILEGKI